MNSNKLEMVKCESLRINMFQTNTWKNLANFPVTLFNHHHAFQKITTHLFI